MPQITLPDGSQRNFDHDVSVLDIAADIGPGLAKATLAALTQLRRREEISKRLLGLRRRRKAGALEMIGDLVGGKQIVLRPERISCKGHPTEGIRIGSSSTTTTDPQPPARGVDEHDDIPF